MEKVIIEPSFNELVNRWQPVLTQCPLFTEIPPQELSGLLSCLDARIRPYERGDTPLTEGHPAQVFGLVLGGEVEIARTDAAGNRHIIGRVGPGGLFGETFACAGEQPSPVTVTAVAPAVMVEINPDRLSNPCEQACVRHQQIIRNLMRILAEKNLLLTQKMDVLTRRTIRGRIAVYLLAEMRRAEYYEFSIPFDRNELAEYLACDRSALSRELSRLRAEGMLDYVRNRFAVLDPHALAAATAI